MSPPGIVMFYACDAIETALSEAAQEPGTFAVGCWKLLRPATVLGPDRYSGYPSLI